MENKYKFLGAVIGLFLIPFLLLSRHFIYGEEELQRNDTLRYMELRTSTSAGIVSDVLNLNYNLGRAAGASAEAAELKKGLAALVKQNPFIYSELALLSPSGAELARFTEGKGPAERLNYGGGPAFAEAKGTGEPAGAVEYGEYTPPALIMAEPVMRNGKPAYYLAGRLSLAYMGEVVRMLGRNSYGNFGLVDMGGQTIADSMSMSIMRPGLKAPAEVVKMLSLAADRGSSTFASRVRFRGRTVLVSVSAVPGSQWWVYEIMSASDLPARKGSSWAWRVVLSGVALIFAFGFISYRLALHWLAGPSPAA